MYLICLGKIAWPSGKWVMFELCEMWKKPPGGLFSLFDLSLDMSSHTSVEIN